MTLQEDRQNEANPDIVVHGRGSSGDDLDHAIVKLLEVDGRKSFSEIAQGHSPQEVETRLGKEASVVYMPWVAGRYGLIVEIEYDWEEHLLAFLKAEMHAAGDLAEIGVMPGLKSFKNQFPLKRNWAASEGNNDQRAQGRNG